MGYWGTWADAMGDNVNMVTEDVYGGEEITAAVWHLGHNHHLQHLHHYRRRLRRHHHHHHHY